MHIAAASGVPPSVSRPSPSTDALGTLTAVVRTADPPETMFGDGFDHRTTDTLMDLLSVDAAEEAPVAMAANWRVAANARFPLEF